jgi:hypothetical protein
MALVQGKMRLRIMNKVLLEETLTKEADCMDHETDSWRPQGGQLCNLVPVV